MPSKSKTKGNAGENELCRIFAATFGGSFKRVFASGAFTGGKNAHRRQALSHSQLQSSKGDIHTPDHLPKLVIESKLYAEFPYHQFLTGEPIALLDASRSGILQVRNAGRDDVGSFPEGRGAGRNASESGR